MNMDIKAINSLIDGLEQPQYSKNLTRLLKQFASRHLEIKKGTELFLKGFEKSLPKGITFDDLISISHVRTTTPHPTEFMSKLAISEYKQFCAVLDKQNPSQEELESSVRNFADALNKPSKKKQIEEETTDTLVGSENLYNALEVTAENIFAAARKRKLVHMKDGVASAADLAKCDKLMEVRTWAPGDSDGKPAQGYKAFEDGVRRNSEAIFRQYIIKTAEIIESLPEGNSRNQAMQVLRRLINTAIENSGNKDRVLKKLGNHLEGYPRNIAEVVEQAIKSRDNLPVYTNSAELVESLYSLKEFEKEGASFAKKSSADALTKLDNLIIGAQNFGSQAQKIEFRQNASVFRAVAKRVRKIEVSLPAGVALKDELIRQANALDGSYGDIQKRLHNGGETTEQERADFYFVDTIKKMAIMVEKPEAFKSILIAECGVRPEGKEKKEREEDHQSAEDVEDTMYLFEAIKKGARKEDLTNQIKITPLFEYNAQIKELPQFIERLIEDKELLTYYQKHGLEIMIAGSDSFKSASSSVVVEMREGIATLRDICKSHGIKLNLYYGTGSGLHRNIINIRHEINFLRTIQGVEMRRPFVDIACEFLRVTTNRLRARKDKQHQQIGFSKAVVDIGNSSAGRNESESNQFMRHNTKKRHKEFDKKYNSPWFAELVDNCLPKKIESDNSFAARPAGRVGGSVATGPQAMRAIGFGQVFNNAGWGAPQLFTEISDILMANSRGSLQGTNIDFAHELYLTKPYLRDIVNRGVNALALSEPDIGWQYVAAKYGLDIKIERDYANFATIKIDKTEYKITDLISDGTTQKALSAQLVKTKGATEAIYAATFLELEHQKASRAVYELLATGALHDGVVGSKKNQPIAPQDLVDLISKINPSYGAELNKQREENKPARAQLLRAFKKQVTEEKLPKRSQKLSEEEQKLVDQENLKTYHAFGILRNNFELPPVNLIYPELGNQKQAKRAA